jgi:hypothetical protein
MKVATRWMWVAAVALAGVPPMMAGGQFDAPAARPVEKEEPGFKVITPQADAKAHTVTLPAAFWDQHMTNWVEVAMCGRPSDFLHETIVSITTTRAKMVDAMRAAGFRDADYWVGNVADFPRVRGDRAMMILEVESGGKKEKFALDELLAYQGWGVSIGPHGWMFKGDPERDGAAPATTATSPATAATTNAAPGEDPQSPAQQILNDDPQVALQFKGLQHLSRSFMDHPLCYDQWIYPSVRYQRNYGVVPRTLEVPKTSTTQPDGKTVAADDAATSLGKFWANIYGSNGDVKSTLTITRVGEEEFLTEMAKAWHDGKFAATIREQLPTAKQIDADKAELEKLVPQLRAMLKKGTPHEDVRDSEVFAKIALATAKLEMGYASLDAAWAAWAADHPVFETIPGDDHALDELKAQAKLWREHMTDWKDRAAFLAEAEGARFDMRAIKAKPPAADTKTLLGKANGKELAARSHALLLENKHPLMYWQYEQGRLGPDETRVDWVRNINTQLELAKSKETMAKAGVALGDVLAKDPTDAGVSAAQAAYKAAVLRMGIAQLEAQLAEVEFNIGKFEAIDGSTELPALKKQQAEILRQLKDLKGEEPKK